MTSREWRLTAFVLAFLGLQAVAVLHELAGGGETLWPFLPWGMFRQSYAPPVEAVRHRILASTAEGTRRVMPEDAGFDRYAFRLHYRLPIAAGDRAKARDLAERLSRRWDTPVRAIGVEETVFTLVGDEYERASSVRWMDAGTR
jgi:hypothetical protein